MNFFRTTFKNLGWAYALRIGFRLIGFVRIAILARLLFPAQFGDFGIVAITLSLLEILTETGINSILIQQKDHFESYIDTAWLISILRGLVISVLMATAAPLISGFFRAPAALPLLYLSSLIPFVRGFINPASIRFQKDLRFHIEFFYRQAINLSEAVAVVILALAFHSASSLVLSLIISAAVEVLLSHLFIRPRPAVKWQVPIAWDIFHRGKWITGFGILDYIYTTGDNITVGRVLGQAPLGIYQNAYSLSTLPISEISDVFYTVTFPVYVQMRDYPKRLCRAVIKGAVLLSAILLVASLGLYFLADPLIRLLLGPRWLAAIPVVKTLAFLGFFRGTANIFNSFFMAVQKTKYVTYITLASTLGLLATIYPFTLHYGIVGAATSAMFGAIIALPFTLYLAFRTLQPLSHD